MSVENKNQEQVQVVDIQFRPGQKIYFFDPAGKHYATGDHVIIDTARGPEYGICAGGNHFISVKDVVSPLRRVLRKASSQDEKTVEENRQLEKKAYKQCMELIEEQKLDMQLVSAECAFDGSKILFFFTADERVDFRELVKHLASTFHTRIELRQIGVRDKARMVGGLGVCGRPFCCATFLDDFQPVSIKMAKTQSLSLNPTKISGTCGRLMCCLKYEQEAYEDLLKNSPKQDSFVDTPEGRGTIVEVNLLRQKVKVRMEDRPEELCVFRNDEIAVLRSGKAKKTDQPIPEDWAPISGNSKKQKKTDEQESGLSLEPIKFRYSEETVAEAVEKKTAPAETEKERENRGSRNRRHHKKANQGGEKTEKTEKTAVQQKPAPQKPAQKKEQPAPKQEEKVQGKQEGEKPAKKRHRRFYHNKPKKNG